MTIRNRTQLMFLTAAILVALCLVGVRQQAAMAQAQAPALAQQMPVDPQITMGKFANGLRYYIRANKKPEKRAELRLVIKAGSILEDDDQQGLAHFVEHMAFNGTQHFPKNELFAFIESLGMRFGADLNAYTSFNETVYMLQVPTDKPELMDRGLLVLEDWAHNLTFDNAEIEKSAASSWKNGAVDAGLTHVCGTSGFRFCSKVRAMPSGCPSASLRSFKTPSQSG
ncbi:MAG: insulinase family protein [Acidobacteria bacterium]|nr:insulinase family protein [Acidobacteriota bacterium]